MKKYTKIHRLRLMVLRLLKLIAPSRKINYKLADGTPFILHVGNSLSEHIYTGRGYEPLETKFVTRYLRIGDTAIDIGANVGYFSTLMSIAVGEKGLVFSIEPGKNTSQLLEHTVRRLKLNNVKILPFAVWKANEIIEFNDSVNGEDAQQSMVSRLKTDGATQSRLVPAYSGDYLLSRCNLRNRWPTLLKIDVEGVEPQVIEGLKDSLTEHAPVLLVELNRESLEAAGNSQELLISSLCSNYDLYFTTLNWPHWWTDQERFKPIVELSGDIHEANLLCIPKSGKSRQHALSVLEGW